MARPSKYTDDELKEMLLKIKTNTTEEITPSYLQNETGIHRSTWTRRMGKVIYELNNPKFPIIGDDEELGNLLPHLGQIVNNYWGKGDKEHLISALDGYNNLLHRFYAKYQDALNVMNENEKLKNENEDLLNEIKELKDSLEFYKQKYLNITAESTYTKARSEKQLKKVLSLKEEGNRKAISHIDSLDIFSED